MFLATVASCGGETEIPVISLPSTSVLSIRSSWGLITENLLRMRENPTKESAVILHVRKATVVEIISRTESREVVEDEEAYWYLVDYSGLKGWVFGAYLEVVDTRSEAEDLAESLQ